MDIGQIVETPLDACTLQSDEDSSIYFLLHLFTSPPFPLFPGHVWVFWVFWPHFINKVLPKRTCPVFSPFPYPPLWCNACRCYSCLWWWSSDSGSQFCGVQHANGGPWVIWEYQTSLILSDGTGCQNEWCTQLKSLLAHWEIIGWSFFSVLQCFVIS